VAMAVSGELEPTNAQKEHSCPADCNRCVEACPTGALYAPYKMDPLRCIAFNSYGAGNFPGAPEDIPPAIREKMGSWIYGCDHCQDACPHNQARLKQKLVPDAFLQEMVPKFDLPVLLAMDDRYFLETVQQLMYGYIWEKKFIQRNAAIALGNSCDEAAVGALGKALQDQQEMVRKYSAWALGRIGGKKSRAALEKALAGENETAVTAEIKSALENC
jgi:epoxyqueuosine reductase